MTVALAAHAWLDVRSVGADAIASRTPSPRGWASPCVARSSPWCPPACPPPTRCSS
ncbi:hypothetical protein QJS66_15295 [Kocuria rhizophila]|nr:hypothetical protein QJS66_15295 [Kocuria rhizophila]